MFSFLKPKPAEIKAANILPLEIDPTLYSLLVSYTAETQQTMCNAVIDLLYESFARRSNIEQLARFYLTLTPREREIADLVYANAKSPEIAEDLSITDNTAKTHLANIKRKMKVSSKKDLIIALNDLHNEKIILP